MTIDEIIKHLQDTFPEAGLVEEDTKPDKVLRVSASALHQVCLALRDDPALAFNCLMCLSGLEMGDELQTVYHLYSMNHRHKFTIRCGVSKEEPSTPTVSDIWATAEWHERESFDLLGIVYENHPDPRRILLPDDWEGHPLRKDYVPQDKWHNIPLTSIVPQGGNVEEEEEA